MTKHTEKIWQIINEFRDAAIERAESLEKTGAVDQDAPHFAKVIAHAAMRDALERNRLITPEGKRDLKNLSHF